MSKDEPEADPDGEKKVVAKKITKETPKAVKIKQPEKEKDTKAKTTASKKGAETSKVKDEQKKEQDKKAPKKGVSTDEKNDTSTPVPAPDKLKDDTKKNNNKSAKPASTTKKAINPNVVDKPKESEATPKGVKRKHEDIDNKIKDTKGDSKKAKPVLSKKRTRANAPSTRSINIKGVERQNIAKTPAKKKQPVKAPADDISITPVELYG